MATITEDYVSFETAALLKEKGFDSPCIGRYSVRSKEFHLDCTKMCNNGGLFEYAAPSQAMAMKWLRRIHNVNIDIVPVWNQKRFEYQIFVITPENAKHCYVDDKLYLGYEEAAELALKYCLKNLI